MKLNKIIYIAAAAAITGLSACGKAAEREAVELNPVEEAEEDIESVVVEEKTAAETVEETPETEQNNKKEKNVEQLLNAGVGVSVEEFLSADNEYVELYRELLESDSYMEDYWYKEKVRCALAKLDEDDIPELFLISDYWHSAPVKIYSADDQGNVIYDGIFISEFGTLKFSPEHNIVAVVDGNQGYFYTAYLYVKDGEVKYLGGATEDGGHRSMLEGGDLEITYFIDLDKPDYESDPSVFGDDSRYSKVMNTESGTITDEEGYGKYIAQFFTGGSGLVVYDRYN